MFFIRNLQTFNGRAISRDERMGVERAKHDNLMMDVSTTASPLQSNLDTLCVSTLWADPRPERVSRSEQSILSNTVNQHLKLQHALEMPSFTLVFALYKSHLPTKHVDV